ncbi:MAG TPA: VOC family protein [Caulobacteraceae bacterium]|nr:VOC family protein [Caulobacteraceae bacterium]
MSQAEPAPAQPKVLSGVAAYLHLDGASDAAAFYKQAFAAEEVARMAAGDGPKLLHVHLYINGASVMLSDAFPEHGAPPEQPAGFTLHLQVDDADAWWDRAVKAGCSIKMPIANMFWGDRYGMLTDPFGVGWSVGSALKKG